MKKLLLASAAALIIAVTFATTSASGASVQALPADEFVNSIGINVHLDYPSSKPWSTVEPLFLNLGIRYLRWGVTTSDTNDDLELVGLYPYGIKAILCETPIVGSTLDVNRISTDLTGLQNLSFSGTSFLSGVEAIEGPNEYDASKDSNWLNDLVSFQTSLYNYMKGDSSYNGILCIAPSMATTTNLEVLPNMASSVDVGNAHPYPGSVSPYTNYNPENINVSEVLRYGPQQDWPGKAQEETENGFETMNGTGGMPESQQAIWLPRLLLENYRLGIQRTYIYDLTDEDLQTDTTNASHHFGLVALSSTNPYTYRAKPAYSAVQNLVSILSDPGSSFTPDYFSYVLSSSNTTLHELTMQKRDGDFYLALWIADTGTTSVSQSETVTFAEPVSRVAQYTPGTSATGTALTITSNSVSVNVTDQVLILDITQAAGPGASVGIVDDLSNLALTYSSTNWATTTPSPASINWWGAASVAQRTSDTTNDYLVYHYPNLDGFSALFGFGCNAVYPAQVNWNISQFVTLYSSPDGSAWTSIPYHMGPYDKTEGQKSQASSRWLQLLSPSTKIPAGTNYLKIAVTQTTGNNTKPYLFETDLTQQGATISGFGNGANWFLNGNGGLPTIASGTAQMTTAVGGEARSIYYATRQDITEFAASFSYTTSGTDGDGICFVIQTDGTSALGATGGSRGYAPTVTPSVAISFNCHNTDSTAVGCSGSQGNLLAYQNASPGTMIRNGVNVSVTYDGTTLGYTVVSASNSSEYFTRSVPVNIPALVGSNTAYIGFSSATGSAKPVNQIWNFEFGP